MQKKFESEFLFNFSRNPLAQIMRNCAKLCKIMRNSAKLCEIVQNYAKLVQKWCEIVQYYAKLCKIMRNCAKLCEIGAKLVRNCAILCEIGRSIHMRLFGSLTWFTLGNHVAITNCGHRDKTPPKTIKQTAHKCLRFFVFVRFVNVFNQRETNTCENINVISYQPDFEQNYNPCMYEHIV